MTSPLLKKITFFKWIQRTAENQGLHPSGRKCWCFEIVPVLRLRLNSTTFRGCDRNYVDLLQKPGSIPASSPALLCETETDGSAGSHWYQSGCRPWCMFNMLPIWSLWETYGFGFCLKFVQFCFKIEFSPLTLSREGITIYNFIEEHNLPEESCIREKK